MLGYCVTSYHDHESYCIVGLVSRYIPTSSCGCSGDNDEHFQSACYHGASANLNVVMSTTLQLFRTGT